MINSLCQIWTLLGSWPWHEKENFGNLWFGIKDVYDLASKYFLRFFFMAWSLCLRLFKMICTKFDHFSTVALTYIWPEIQNKQLGHNLTCWNARVHVQVKNLMQLGVYACVWVHACVCVSFRFTNYIWNTKWLWGISYFFLNDCPVVISIWIICPDLYFIVSNSCKS